MNILSFISLLTTVIGDAPKVLAALSFIMKAISDAEATGQTGEQKLDAVLNDFEAFLNANFPSLAAPFETIAAGLEAAVTEIIAVLNAIGLFKSTTPAT